MIAYLEGTVLHHEEDILLIQTGQVGYELTVTAEVLSSARDGQELALFVHTHQPQNQPMTLFGFSSLAERKLFRRLIEVDSVGPKVAIRVLAMPLAHLRPAIAGRDIATLSKIKGLGKKTAEKICLALSEEMAQMEGLPVQSIASTPSVEEASLALRQLGFATHEIQAALAKLDHGLSAEEMIPQALRFLAN